jgi:hypothetical protein
MRKLLILLSIISAKNMYAQGSGYALNFDATNDQVQGNAADLSAITNNFTIEFWFNASATITTKTEQNGVSDISGTTGNGQRYVVYPEHGGGANGVWGNAGAGVSVGSNAIQVYEHKASYMPCLLTYSGGLIQAGWNHIAVVYINKRPRLYVNGINAKDGLTSQQNNVFPGATIGGSAYGWYSGDLDEFRIWNTTRTQAQIRANMCVKLVGNEAGLVRYYRFDDGLGATTVDATGTHNGTLVNMNPPTDWISSGAPIGSSGNRSYVGAGWTGATTLTHVNPSGQDELTISSMTGTPAGVHIYGESQVPNVICGANGVGGNDRYFGVFVVNGTTTVGTPTYSVTYNYANNPYVNLVNEPNLDIAQRTTNAVTSCNAWSNLSATINMVGDVLVQNSMSGRNEFILTSATTPLPIGLLSFEANFNVDKVDLRWITFSEVNNNFFTIERSKDALTWEDVLRTQGAGNSNVNIEYFESDYNPHEGVSYYRLKQTDFDGNFEYFNIVPVKVDLSDKGEMNLFPNPLKRGDELNITLEGIKEDVLIVIRDAKGQEFYSKAQIHYENNQLIAVPISVDIPAGFYIVTASSENQIYSQKLLIK